jgi:hypothetical protein
MPLCCPNKKFALSFSSQICLVFEVFNDFLEHYKNILLQKITNQDKK